jgi:hypothetical protein
MRILLPLCGALLTVCCSNTLTGPTPVTSEPSTASPALMNLRWDVSAPGCPVKSPPSPLPNPAEARLEPGPHGTIVAYWPAYAMESRRVTLHATLVETDAQLLVCDWDIADL